MISSRIYESFPYKKDGIDSYFFIVAFENIKKPNYPRLMMVETFFIGDQGIPKVNADAFLDIYDEAPIQYLESKSEEPQDILAIISPSSFCFDNIPNAQKKATIFFLSRPDKKAHFAKAYISTESALYKELSDIRIIGESCLANIRIDINRKEDPKNPYLEVIGINSYSWH